MSARGSRSRIPNRSSASQAAEQGSGGLGLSMGVAIGQALAHRGSGRFFVQVSGDGEFLFTPSSLWTLSHLGLPMLTVINNNRLYGNDEGHQEHMARTRERPVENKYIGIALDRPVDRPRDPSSLFWRRGVRARREPR